MDGKYQVKVNVSALVIMVITFFVLMRTLLSQGPFSLSFPLFFFLIAYGFYIILHELTHGVAIKLLTGAKVDYAIHWTAASAGNPDLFFHRFDYIVIALAPFFVWSFLGMLLFYLLPARDHFGFSFLFAAHMGGCVGDYICAWKAYRYRDGYVKDTGTKMEFYAKKEASGWAV